MSRTNYLSFNSIRGILAIAIIIVTVITTKMGLDFHATSDWIIFGSLFAISVGALTAGYISIAKRLEKRSSRP
jgi:hypothetical protein